MRVISREKPKENEWSAIFRCVNEECQAVLEINQDDVIADPYYYDRDFDSYEFSYYYECPVCGKRYDLPLEDINFDFDVREIVEKRALRRKIK